MLLAAFFTRDLNSFVTPLWTTFTGISFALQGTASNFLTSCIFAFPEQPYDVGDHVMIDDKELIVKSVFLMYSVFHKVTDEVSVQLSHTSISSKWIANLSRSNQKSYSTVILIDTIITANEIANIEKELNKTISNDPYHFRYIKEIELQFIWTKDLKRELQVKIPYSNRVRHYMGCQRCIGSSPGPQ